MSANAGEALVASVKQPGTSLDEDGNPLRCEIALKTGADGRITIVAEGAAELHFRTFTTGDETQAVDPVMKQRWTTTLDVAWANAPPLAEVPQDRGGVTVVHDTYDVADFPKYSTTVIYNDEEFQLDGTYSGTVTVTFHLEQKPWSDGSWSSDCGKISASADFTLEWSALCPTCLPGEDDVKVTTV